MSNRSHFRRWSLGRRHDGLSLNVFFKRSLDGKMDNIRQASPPKLLLAIKRSSWGQLLVGGDTYVVWLWIFLFLVSLDPSPVGNLMPLTPQ